MTARPETASLTDALVELRLALQHELADLAAQVTALEEALNQRVAAEPTRPAKAGKQRPRRRGRDGS
jgi:hypothetical protein